MPSGIKLSINKWDKFNRLLIIEELPLKNRHRNFKCLCDCWNEKNVLLDWLISWHTKSCWCFNLEIITKHWKTNTKLYRIYYWAKSRCNNKSNKDYNSYWWRWIKFCWNSFDEFYKDMWDSNINDFSLDRIDVNWNYCKENCRWLSLREQAWNTRKNIIPGGLKKYCRDIGFSYSLMIYRISKWMDIETSINTPIKKYKKTPNV